MRFFTILSSVLLVGAGAFCFAFYMNGYAGVALVLGGATLLCGLFHFIAYFIGFRKSRLPESVLIEGLMNLTFGFMIVVNLIPELQINTYFGIWAFVVGIVRVSEAFAVSKVNPRNWFAVLPLGLVSSVIGFTMMNPSLIASLNVDTVYVIAVFYIVNALSMFLYAMYMIKREPSKKANEARQRAEAKKLEAEGRRKERDRIRSLSETERAAERALARQEKIRKDEEKKAEKAARKEARRPASERTVEFTTEETEEINRLMDVPTTEEIKLDDEKRPVINLEKIEEEVVAVELPKIELPEVELKAEGGENEKRKDILLSLEEESPKQEDPEDLNSFTPLTLEELFADERFNIKPLTDQRATETDLKLTQTFTFDWLNTKR